MTYTLLVKLWASVVLAASMVATSTPVTMEYPATTTPTTTPRVAAVVVKKETKGDCSEYASIISKYDWPKDTAMRICKAESSGNPKAINWQDSHKDSKGNVICVSSQGLLQLGCFWPETLGYEKEDLLDPEKNIAMAYKIWAKQGWSPWSTY